MKWALWISGTYPDKDELRNYRLIESECDPATTPRIKP